MRWVVAHASPVKLVSTRLGRRRRQEAIRADGRSCTSREAPRRPLCTCSRTALDLNNFCRMVQILVVSTRFCTSCYSREGVNRAKEEACQRSWQASRSSRGFTLIGFRKPTGYGTYRPRGRAQRRRKHDLGLGVRSTTMDHGTAHSGVSGATSGRPTGSHLIRITQGSILGPLGRAGTPPYSPPKPKSRAVRALGAKSAKKVHVHFFGTRHPANAKTHKTVRDRPRPKIAWAGLHSGLGLRPLGGSQGALPVLDPSGYWEESSHVGRLGTHHVQGVDTVCAACKALAERAKRDRGKFSAKASKVPKHLQCRSKLKISKIAWLPRVQIPKPFLFDAENKVCRKLKTSLNFLSLRILGVEYARRRDDVGSRPTAAGGLAMYRSYCP